MKKSSINYNQLFKDEISKNGYIVLNKKELKDIVEMSMPAFADYELYHYLTPKFNLEHWITFKWRTFKSFYKDAVIFTDSTRSCCAVIFCNNCRTTNTFKYLIHGVWKSLFSMGAKAIHKMNKFEKFADKLRKKHTNYDSLYWFDLAVKKESQGKGIATAIFKIVLDFCDKHKRDLYFETHNEENAELYSKQGCTLVEKVLLPQSDIIQYCFLYKHK